MRNRMTTTHVFIVDKNTFKIHLEHMFVGTGSKDHIIDFNSKTSKMHHATEKNLCSMMADSQRIRKGDYIIFYLQQNLNGKEQEKIKEGKFYGIFKAEHDLSFLDDNDDNQYLNNELNKSLTFRALICPHEVYAEGITEWHALDEIKNINSPNQMLWSLIYRKLKGNRGNTMITIYESEKLFKLIRNKNENKKLSANNLTFDIISEKIIPGEKSNGYTGRKEKINILPQLIYKHNRGNQFETHLQTYILQNIGKNGNKSLDKSIFGNNNINIEWIGNEVSCGVGMQRIDIMVSNVINEYNRTLYPIELKSKSATSEITNQLQRYIDWIEQYYIPNRHSDIQPIIISRKIGNKNNENYDNLINSFNKFNNKNKNTTLKLKYIEFEINDNSIQFNDIVY